jgi:hypothetical protein
MFVHQTRSNFLSLNLLTTEADRKMAYRLVNPQAYTYQMSSYKEPLRGGTAPGPHLLDCIAVKRQINTS